ncbi:MAG: hypothetical protein AAF714_12050, partial [Pseudomonadota bacterium]
MGGRVEGNNFAASHVLRNRMVDACKGHCIDLPTNPFIDGENGYEMCAFTDSASLALVMHDFVLAFCEIAEERRATDFERDRAMGISE